MKQKRIIPYILIVILLALLAGSNFYWFKTYNKEQETLKHAIIPSLSDDYFTRQLALTKYLQIFYDSELEGIKYDEKKQVEVPHIYQLPEYPNGCEAASATMLLNYYKIPTTLSSFVHDYLPTKEVKEENGLRFGPNPSKYYAGDPTDEKRGWGCFDRVIKDSLENILKDYQQQNKEILSEVFLNINKSSLSSISNSLPLMIWVTTDYEASKEVYEWFSYDKKRTYTYPKNSHAVVVTGYDENYYYINDPLKTEKKIPVKKEILEKSFDSLGRQSIYLDFVNIDSEKIEK